MKSGMDRKTGRKYLKSRRLPSSEKTVRKWRTRVDPFIDHWPEVVEFLQREPKLQAKTLFCWLQEKYPGRYQDGQLRTLERRVRIWRALFGPDQEIFFPQEHSPGEMMETDWTDMNDFAITIDNQPFPHKLCHSVLPYSNAETVTICQSESFLSLKKHLKPTATEWGALPTIHRTDHSSTATHQFTQKGKKRVFNPRYLDLLAALSLKPSVTNVRAPEENGDIEGIHQGFKSRLEPALLLRGNRDFKSREEYGEFLQDLVKKANAGRSQRFREEVPFFHAVDPGVITATESYRVRVNKYGMIRVKKSLYRVPSRLVGQVVEVVVGEDDIQVFFQGTFQYQTPRVQRNQQAAIDYRHVVRHLIRKPGALARYRFKEQLFPRFVFRQCYEQIQMVSPGTSGDRLYLQILLRAVEYGEEAVASLLTEYLEQGITLSCATLDTELQNQLGQKRDDLLHLVSIPPARSDQYDALISTHQEVPSK